MKKIISIILILSFVFVILSGCNSNTTQTEETNVEEMPQEAEVIEPININVAAPAGAPTLSMIKMFKENPSFGEDVNINYESIQSPDLVASRIISGEIDIAVVPTNLAVTLYNRGIDYKLASSNVWGVLYIVGNEEIDSWEDLRGKEIYTMGRGLTPDIVFRYLLASNAIDPETDVTLTYMGEATELASAFIAGKSSISLIPEPALSNVILKKEDTKILFDLQEEWSKLNEGNLSYPQASLIIKNDVIENHPEFVEMFLQEYKDSINWLKENVDKAAEYSEELEIGLSKAAVIQGLDRSNIKYVGAKDARKDIDSYLKVLFDYSPEVIGGKLPDEDFYLQK